MAFGFVRRLRGKPGRRSLAILAVLAVIVAGAGILAAQISGDAAPPDFLAYLDEELFRDDPLSAHGNNWDVTHIVRAYSRYLEPGETLIQIIEENIPLHVEHKRHREEDGPITERAYKINRNHLDPLKTDRLLYFKKTYRPTKMFFYGMRIAVAGYELSISVHTKHGETEETIEAYLRFESL